MCVCVCEPLEKEGPAFDIRTHGVKSSDDEPSETNPTSRQLRGDYHPRKKKRDERGYVEFSKWRASDDERGVENSQFFFFWVGGGDFLSFFPI